ncbi:MAG: DUF5596 domain-containing protein [Planctomycetes bacterium]|nr:DUF5596 domain-containing protein [Planctomycetota bacterium]
MNLENLLARLGMDAPPDALCSGWDDSSASCSDSSLFFLDPAYVSEQCGALQMMPDTAAALMDGLRLFTDVPELKLLAWHCHRQFYGTDARSTAAARVWPLIPAAVHECAGLFYAYVFLSGAPSVFSRQRELGIPREITVDTLSDLELWLRHGRDTRGIWGFDTVPWISLHFSSGLYKLGRLQFNFSTYSYPYNVFRNSSDARVVVLAAHGMKFRTDGQVDGANGISDDNAWEAEYLEKPGEIHGTPISPLGHAIRDTIVLPTDRWNLVLTEGYSTLGTHIPATGPMSHHECGDSFRRAVAFFGKYYPGHTINAFTCSSWLLDNQFTEYLKPDSNIVRFLKEWYLIPNLYANDGQTLERVFGDRKIRLDKAPRDTSLRRAIIAHMEKGGRWRSTGGLIFPGDIDWGGEVYRSGKTSAV